MFRRFATAVYHLKWPILLGMILITAITGNALRRLQIDPSMETLFIKNSPEYKYYREYSEKYGSDQMIAVAMATTDIFTIPNLRKLIDINHRISQLEEVERVLSLANAMDIRSKFIGIKIVPALKGVFEGKRSMAELKADVLSNELYLNNLISRDGKVANLLVYLKPIGKKQHLSGKAIDQIRKILAEEEKPGVTFYMAGSPVEQFDFIKLIRRDQFTFVPMITALLILTTFLIYRSFACMILAMSIVFVTLCWLMGTIAFLGQQLNLMTSLLAPVLMIVSVINSIYLMNLFFELRPHHPSLKNCVVMTMDMLGIPCLLTHFVAVLGFISLALTPIPAIQSFGLFAALGTFYSYIVEVVLTPILLPLLPYRISSKTVEKKNVFSNMFVSFLEQLDLKWKWWIVALTFVVIGFSVKGISMLEVDTNIIKQMKPNLPLAISTRFIDEHLTGVYSLGFVLKRKDGGTIAEHDTLVQIDSFKTYLESKPEISKVNSITTVLKKINQARANENPAEYKITENPGYMKRYFDGIMDSGDPEVWKLISHDLKEVRLEARMKAVGTKQGAMVEDTSREFLEKNLSQTFDYQLTGNVVLLGRMAKGLIGQQIHSFEFALLSILVVIIVLFRSIPLGMLAAIPNLIPILAVYGLMGFIPIELSTPTAMISSIVLGLVVDASIQFIYRFKLEFEHRKHYLQALHHTYRNTGMSMFVSTLILCVGFASSVFANFRPTVHFGVLTSLTIFFALICTLVVLPVCLLIFKPFGRQRLFAKKKSSSESIHAKH